MPTRRQFVAALGAFAVFPFERMTPELILHDGNIFTVDTRVPEAQALAIAGGRIFAVGSNEDVLSLKSPLTKVINLDRKTVLPGFNDAHSHPLDSGLAHLKRVDCGLPSIAAIQQALHERAQRIPPGQWVLGFKYDDTKTSDGRPLTIQDLDEAVSDHPVLIDHRGGHTAWVNSAAVRAAGVNPLAGDPPGGKFFREGGRFTGHIAEHAKDPFLKLIPNTYTREDYRAAAKLLATMMSRTGITSACDADGAPEFLRGYQDAAEAGELPTRIYCFIDRDYFQRMQDAGARTGLGDERVRIGGMKFYCDGSISERTARVSQPYVGRPDDHGMMVNDAAALYEQMREPWVAGWQLGTHANGDVAIDTVLGVYERLQREHPRRDARLRLEHCTIINDALVRRIAALGAIPVPFATYVYFHGEKMREYGAERLNSMFALRSFLDAGIPVAWGSDYVPGPFEPMMAMQSAVTRTDSKGTVWGAKQRIAVAEAIRVGTLNGAHASFEENQKGSLAIGKLADLVVLGRDPFKEPPNQLINIPVERTMLGGRWVFEA